jgi:predicted nucleic acid-binding protein
MIVDASLMAKLVVKEVDSEMAFRWFGTTSANLFAPDLMATEVANAIVRRVNTQLISRHEGQRTLDEWFALCQDGTISFRRIATPLLSAASEIAVTIGHTLSDCIYLALAIDLDCDLATCDAKFHGKAFPVFGRVRLLSELMAH